MILLIYLLGSFLFIISFIVTFFLNREDITINALWRMIFGASLSWISLLFFLLLFISGYLESRAIKVLLNSKNK